MGPPLHECVKLEFDLLRLPQFLDIDVQETLRTSLSRGVHFYGSATLIRWSSVCLSVLVEFCRLPS